MEEKVKCGGETCKCASGNPADMHGVSPTCKEIKIRVLAIYCIEDEQVAEAWFVEEEADTLRQLGVWQ